MSNQTVVTSGACFLGSEDGNPHWAESVLIDNDRVAFVGTNAEVRSRADTAARWIDASGGLVMPAFVEAHTHLLMLGESLIRPDLRNATSFDEITAILNDHLRAHPELPRLVGGGWLFGAVPGGKPSAALLDEPYPEIPVYLTANDLHSVWVNSAALREMGVDAGTTDPVGGHFGRDAQGNPDGMLYESAAQDFAWAYLAEHTTQSENKRAMREAMRVYLEAGVTSAVDMMMDARAWQTLQAIASEDGETLPMRVAAHWSIPPADNVEVSLDAVRTAAEHARDESVDNLRVVGIKIVVDGVIDACTAAMSKPFSTGEHPPAFWEQDALNRVVQEADSADLLIAIHAIGNHASELAITALESLPDGRARRHRIEHLELVDPENIARIAKLGITASMQPVHADPAIQDTWEKMVGAERAEQGYPWREFESHGARLAFGTDAPTAPFAPAHNLYVAATRASALDPGLKPIRPNKHVPLANAIEHATRDSARASQWAQVRGAAPLLGSLEVGAAADLIVFDVNPFETGVDSLLTARPQAVFRGGVEITSRD
ncbi:MAG: amidohydrolase [Gulosibacter sp.]|uniref:amidohydrolase n=1 Tax=Gulosibacter sp. TaxID=2817531 RepID=UPI003F8E75BE